MMSSVCSSSPSKILIKTAMSEERGKIISSQIKATWIIQRFDPETDYTLRHASSPDFKVDGGVWKLYLETDKKSIYGDPLINVLAECPSDLEAPFPQVDISLVNKNMSKNYNLTLKQSPAFNDGEKFYIADELFKREDVMLECVDKGTLRVVCVITNASAVDYENRLTEQLCSYEDAVHTFAKLFDKKEHSDFVVVVQGKEIYVRQSILLAKSQAFREILVTGNILNRINILDYTYEAMYTVLEYVYAGINERHRDLDYKTCQHVLAAATKFKLDFMRKAFEQMLATKFDNNNVIDCLITACMDNYKHVKEKAIDYIVVNSKTIVKSLEFQNLIIGYPDIVCEIFRAFSMKLEA